MSKKYIWDSTDYPWGDDPGLDMLKVEYDKQKKIENRFNSNGIGLTSYHQPSSELAKKMKIRATKTGIPIHLASVQNSLNSNNPAVKVSGNGSTEKSVTNSDGSVTITRERQINNGGTMQTQSGSIRLMPEFETANGAPAAIDNTVKNQLFDLSESKGGMVVDVHSGTRTKAQNDILVRKGTGARNSAHLSSDAADISIGNNSSSQTATDAYNSGLFNRVNIYSNGGVHVDNKPRPNGSMGYYRDWQRVGDVTPRTKPTPPKRNK
ncbi:D-Ala-D-Ala carboxypeptidase family metallohydrolase [Pseudemcibacter aquimaris]|uniref:D-Ala-D-Ala carboxypeptidase family metallohydrolase n=1 Tax=Pseudemcibacter aquimaris TaxID=2857064 RepID=UPI002012B85B|nr:D-Ala-D-Ala carboxypeptidase family metallohydrolase [Pseudemcibacter aquimaris]MCC3859865.1 D-Ala-D-Ala carboxypeptidase family metallohydrolase [Pseudemcibacter aquimaris]WDU57197.1 hypothetical protein KW060_08300 [Pseudemcibacter aquimaris]